MHVRELLLHQLGCRDRSRELDSVERILSRCVPAKFSSAHGAPANAVASPVETAKRARKSRCTGKNRIVRDKHIAHPDCPGCRCSQREFPFDGSGREPRKAAFENETADLVVMAFRSGPDDKDIRDRRVGDPCLFAIQHVSAVDFPRPCRHARRVRTVVRFSQPETADQLAARETRQVGIALSFRAVGVDRKHDERRLDREETIDNRCRPVRLRARSARRTRS